MWPWKVCSIPVRKLSLLEIKQHPIFLLYFFFGSVIRTKFISLTQGISNSYTGSSALSFHRNNSICWINEREARFGNFVYTHRVMYFAIWYQLCMFRGLKTGKTWRSSGLQEQALAKKVNALSVRQKKFIKTFQKAVFHRFPNGIQLQCGSSAVVPKEKPG